MSRFKGHPNVISSDAKTMNCVFTGMPLMLPSHHKAMDSLQHR